MIIVWQEESLRFRSKSNGYRLVVDERYLNKVYVTKLDRSIVRQF